ERALPADAGDPPVVEGREAVANAGARERANDYLQIPPRCSPVERRASGANGFGEFRLRLPESIARVLDRESRFRKGDRRREMNTKQLAKIFIGIITGLALIAITIGCKTKAQEKAIKPVKVKTVETHTGTSSVRYSASIRPSSQVEVSFKVGGYVEAIKHESGRYIQAGDTVGKGAVLAQLRQSDYAAKVNEARSQQG